MTIFAYIPFIPDWLEFGVFVIGTWSYGYVKGARRKRLPRGV